MSGSIYTKLSEVVPELQIPEVAPGKQAGTVSDAATATVAATISTNNNNNKDVEHKPASTNEENQYLDLVRDILENGEHRPDRTGTGTLSIFAPPPLKFSLGNDTFPLLTTKRVHIRSILHELLWFISGNTSTEPLQQHGIKIWDGNGSRAYLDSIGLSTRKEGDLGPVYGFQWRHFGAEYIDAGTDYTGKGVDQLAEVVHKLKHAPYDRRIILSAWNVADLKKMALPPCHMFAQFYVSFPPKVETETSSTEAHHDTATSNFTSTAVTTASASSINHHDNNDNNNNNNNGDKPKGTLHCQLYQRSCDMGLGVPFNIASYALLTKMLAMVSGLEAGTFTHVMGDAHVYLDHVDALKRQLNREPREWPKCRITRQVDDIDDFKFEDFVVEEYDPWPGILMKMSV